jgi:hypothetical protein
MSYQLVDIVSLVQKRVRDTNYDTSEIIQYINDTQNDVFMEYRLPFMETTQNYTTVANVTDITNGSGVPSNYLVAIDLLNVTGGNQTLIPFRDISALDDIDQTSGSTSTSPEFWYMYGQTPRLYPTISTALSLTLRYYKMPTQLSANSDIPALPYAFQELLVVGAAYRVMQVKDNYDQAAILQNKYDEILAKLVSNTAVRQVGQSAQQRLNRVTVTKRHF